MHAFYYMSFSVLLWVKRSILCFFVCISIRQGTPEAAWYLFLIWKNKTVFLFSFLFSFPHSYLLCITYRVCSGAHLQEKRHVCVHDGLIVKDLPSFPFLEIPKATFVIESLCYECVIKCKALWEVQLYKVLLLKCKLFFCSQTQKEKTK